MLVCCSRLTGSMKPFRWMDSLCLRPLAMWGSMTLTTSKNPSQEVHPVRCSRILFWLIHRVILAEYDLFQLRAVLFNCSSAEIEVTEDFNAAVRSRPFKWFFFRRDRDCWRISLSLEKQRSFYGIIRIGRALSKLASSLVSAPRMVVIGKIQRSCFFRDHLRKRIERVSVSESSAYQV